MAVLLERFAVDGDVYEVLEDCDQLWQGLGRLRRQGQLSDPTWRSSIEHLEKIRAGIEAHLTPQ